MNGKKQITYHYFKKGSRNKSENNRPASLASVICKLLERLIKDHLVDLLIRHTLLNSSQHGFLKAWSCLEEITKWLDEGSPVDVMLFSENIIDWIEQWLTEDSVL